MSVDSNDGRVQGWGQRMVVICQWMTMMSEYTGVGTEGGDEVNGS
jgi:hypothetical protein